MVLSQGVFGRNRSLPLSFVQKTLLVETKAEAAQLMMSHGLRVTKETGEGLCVIVGGNDFKQKGGNATRRRSAVIGQKKKGTKYSVLCTSPCSTPVV